MGRASSELVAGFITMGVGLALGFVAAVAWTERRRGGRPGRTVAAALAAAAWLALTGLGAARGVIAFDSRPPTFMVLMGIMIVGTVALARSPLGRRLAAGLPLALLVGWQGFRLPLELMMHRAQREGLMPVQMSYEGMNFDIVTGATALVVAALIAAGRASRRLVWAWNILGSVLLLNIVTIAVLSTPTPLRVFHNSPPNVWVTQFPFIWLPTVMVAMALLGHLLIFQRLSARDRPAASRPAERQKHFSA